jgi:hypothetical protein
MEAFRLDAVDPEESVRKRREAAQARAELLASAHEVER